MAQAIVTIDGFLSKDSELGFTKATGSAFLRFSIPVTPQKKTEQGWEDTGPTQWYDLALWSMAEPFFEKLKKGTRVKVTGNLTTREHEGKTYQQVRVDQIGIISQPKSQQAPQGGFGGTQPASDPWATAGPSQPGGYNQPGGQDQSPPF